MESASTSRTCPTKLSSSAPTSPSESEQRIKANMDDFNHGGKGRKVQFPADEQIVTKYFDAPDPWCYLAPQHLTAQNLVDAYRAACENQGIKPLSRVVSQLQKIQSFNAREEDLNLKGERLDAKSCEALEEIFKRIRFRCVNMESCSLDEEGASAVFDMIEYYESCSHLNIANNKGIDMRGWQACCRMMKKTPCLQYLDLRNCSLSEQVLLILGRALRLGSHLISLRLERSGISSRALAILVAALKLNTTLRYLFLGDNKLCPGDAIQISNLLKANSTLELLDLRDNDLQDEGLEHISEALRAQPNNPGVGLKHLILKSNQITQRGMNPLVEALPYASSLRSINLNGNAIGDEGIIKLKEGVTMAPKLKGLGLRNCKITDQALSSLSRKHLGNTWELLKRNTRTRFANLLRVFYYSFLDDKSEVIIGILSVGMLRAIAVAECFMESDSITRVDVRENTICERGLRALLEAAQQNSRVHNIDIDTIIAAMDPSTSSTLQQLVLQLNKYCEENQKKHDMEEDSDIQGLCSPGALASLLLNGIQPDEFLDSAQTENLEHVTSDSEDSSNESRTPLMSTRKPILRSSSLESWESQSARKSDRDLKRSGRFSVSPVPDSESPPPFKTAVPAKRPDNFVASSSSLKNPILEKLQASGESINVGSSIDEVVHTGDIEEKMKKRISFALPDESHDFGSSEAFRNLSKRRMSSPAVSTNARPKNRPKIPSLKEYKILDGLDLRSSVPLSPTRLYQGLDFLETVSAKISPSKSTEPSMIKIAN